MTTQTTPASINRTEALQVRSTLKAGGLYVNHNEALQVRSALKAGGVQRLFLVAMLLTVPTASQAQSIFLPLHGELHIVRAKHSGKCLDVAWFSTANGAPVVQSTCTHTENQQWLATWVHAHPWAVVLTAKHSGKALDIFKSDSLQRAVQQQLLYSAGAQFWYPSVTQYWYPRYIKTVNGVQYYAVVQYYAFATMGSDFCLDVPWFTHQDGAELLSRPCTFADNQLFEFVPMSWMYQ